MTIITKPLTIITKPLTTDEYVTVTQRMRAAMKDDDMDTIWEPARANYVFSHDMGMCMCGNPEAAIELIQAILELIEARDRDEVIRLCGGEAQAQIILGVMTSADLIEHGCSIFGSWLTGHGKRWLDSVMYHGREAVADSMWKCDDKGGYGGPVMGE
jgi:hypothetical protein